MRGQKLTTMDEAEVARRIVLAKLMEEGIIPGPMPPTLFRSVGVKVEEPEYLNYFIEVVLPLQVDVSTIPQEVDGVRVLVVHEDRHWIATTH